MRILITGATGFVGSRLAPRLFKDGHDLVILSRDTKRVFRQLGVPCQVIECDLVQGPPPPDTFSGIEAVLHLAGDPRRYCNSEQKKSVAQLQIIGTRNLVKSLKAAGGAAPSVLLSASTIDFFGDRGDEPLSECSMPGFGFHAHVSRAKEAEAQSAECSRTRVAVFRLGMVLGENGGRLSRLLKPFSLGLGARLGSGKQWVSWIHIDDVVEAFSQALNDHRLTGIINLVAPRPVLNQEFAVALAACLNRSPWLRVPGPLIRAISPETAFLALGGSKVVSEKLASLDFRFSHPSLEQALNHIFREFPKRTFEKSFFIGKTLAEVLHFFTQPKTLQAITPPLFNLAISDPINGILQTGGELNYRLKSYGVPIFGKMRIEEYRRNTSLPGLGKEEARDPGSPRHYPVNAREGTLLTDCLSYLLPLGGLGDLLAGAGMEKIINDIFHFRACRIPEFFG